MVYKLYDYQQDLVRRTRSALRDGNQGVLIVSPPGSGKSVVIAEIARLTTEKGHRVLFTVHRKELVEQITETFQKQGVNLDYCTILTVGKVFNRLHQLPRPDLIITDETHHSRAKTYRYIYDYYKEVPRLGFTGSPWRMNGQGFDDIYSVMIKSLSVKQLVVKKFLAPYAYYSVNLTNEKALKTASTGEYTNQSIDQALGSTIFGDVVKNYRHFAEGRQAILYAHSVEYSKRFAHQFHQAGIPAAHADSKTPASERQAIMEAFKTGQINVLCNCDLISEGFDVPDCSCVILARPTQSLVLFLQQSMRAMRYQPGKKAIIIDHVANYTRHGLPDDPRQWSLYGRPKKKRGEKKRDAPPLTTCPYCFGVIPTQTTPCPLCGRAIETEPKELKQVDQELIAIKPITLNYKRLEVLDEYREKSPHDLHTLEDYYLYAKAHHYKEGWIKYQAPQAKQLSWPAFYSQLKKIKEKN
ncbi:MAG: DEAD/DEAH box helicase [Aerococcus sp.]|nr:DEAD/DEAH box helicase [Aerococcus sp.]